MIVQILSVNLCVAVFTFFAINWIGPHATDFGYTSLNLFDNTNESLAINFIIRSFTPTVIIVALSTVVVSFGYDDLRYGLYLSTAFYFVIRFGIIVLWGRAPLVSWNRFLLQVGVGVGAAYWAYFNLILPKTPLLPNLQTAGNELWLIIIGFLYAIANKIQAGSGPSAKKKNRYVADHLQELESRFSSQLSPAKQSPLLYLITISILIYENYNRPRFVRSVERIFPAKWVKTVGPMQVKSSVPLSDEASVAAGVQILTAEWARLLAVVPRPDRYTLAKDTIGKYNRDEKYVGDVFDLMHLISNQVRPEFREVYGQIFSDDPVSEQQPPLTTPPPPPPPASQAAA